ncbi:HAD family hydrolase [Amycolatopsis tolypomycina]|uniref:Haloacid dehalogenase superfamily, subfamily IA, variant 3 with third motif having DD or ED n=2 Tax=Amycolatopsis tolypomycina TaxID=208445 RepID=A0A1H4YVW5_9PSEU|nr:HAD-IA family hydrolase [Amycolatopsis tolypomycina]SED21807.1 haloacid dehalogenase superfamily, subfamily IA, variant 3 with third motif having DD or ED [Amycolatopsis tolypomycina]
MLGLPGHITTCLFDLDGVIIRSTHLHNAAWGQALGEFLAWWSEQDGRRAVAPYDADTDYRSYLDGKRRVDGARSFLASRDITLPDGRPTDPAGAPTLHGLGNRKHQLSDRLISERGVAAYPGSLEYLRAVMDSGLKTGLVTSSANSARMLAGAGIDGLFEVRVDARTAASEGLRGKPFPDTFLIGARWLNAEPRETAVFEDAPAGVEAGRAGNFGYVVGVDRMDHAPTLLERGADIVVTDLSHLLTSDVH